MQLFSSQGIQILSHLLPHPTCCINCICICFRSLTCIGRFMVVYMLSLTLILLSLSASRSTPEELVGVLAELLLRSRTPHVIP